MDTILLTMLILLLVATTAILYLNIKSKPKGDSKEAEEIANLNAEIVRLKDSLNTKSINDLNSIIKNLEESAQTDSVIIVNKDKTIADLEEKSKLIEKKVKLVKPSWYENKWLYFGYGATLSYAVLTLANKTGNIADLFK